jgi:hypothetical protein
MKNYFTIALLSITLFVNAQENLMVYYNYNISAQQDQSDYNRDGDMVGNAEMKGDFLNIPADNVSAFIIPPDAFNGLSDFTIHFHAKFKHIHKEHNNTFLSSSRTDCANCYGVAFDQQDSSWIVMFNGIKHFIYDPSIKWEEWLGEIILMRQAGTVYFYKNFVNEDNLLATFYDSSTVNITSLLIGQEEGCEGGCYVDHNGLDGGTGWFKIYSSAVFCTDLMEPNDTSTEAFPILTNKMYDANLYFEDGGSANDWFQFKIDTLHQARITLYNLPDNFNMELYDSALNLIGLATNPGVQRDTIIANYLTSGTYLIHVFPIGFFNLCYSIIVETSIDPWEDIPTSVTTESSKSAFDFFPNPVSSIINLKCSTIETSSLSIIDQYGRFIKEFQLDRNSNNITLDLNDLANGIYCIAILGNEKRMIRKFVVSK